MHGMLIRFRTSGRKLNPDKCKFKQRKIKFYGIICIEDGVKPDPEKVCGTNKYQENYQLWLVSVYWWEENYFHAEFVTKS